VQVESENYDEFLKALGVGMLLRKVKKSNTCNINFLSFDVFYRSLLHTVRISDSAMVL
jgi:hypothetical protein